jgi:allophanate hydrolase subunit 2
MTGELPVRRHTDEVISRGVPVGAVELPPGDELLILHRGRGVTAGYPVLAVVTPLSLDELGQARPGDSVSFRRTTIEQAGQDMRSWRTRLDLLRRRVDSVFASLGVTDLLEPRPNKPDQPNPSTPALEGV